MPEENPNSIVFRSPPIFPAAERRQPSFLNEGEVAHALSSSSSKPTRKVAFKGDWVLSHTFDSVAIQIGRHVKLLQDINDVRVRELQSKLISEQSRLCSWARDRNITSITHLESMLSGFPASTKATISSLCDVLRTWMQDSVSNLEKYSFLVVKSSGVEREEELNFIIDCYHLLETLRTVNNGLFTVASSLSNRNTGKNWDRSVSGDTVSPWLSVPASDLQELPGDIPEVGQEIGDSTLSEVGTTDYSNRDYTVSGHERSPSGLQVFFTNCLRALQVATTLTDQKEDLRRLYSHLSVWGCGLFPASMNLDQILDPELEFQSEAAANFRSHIVGILADIAIILESLLKCFDTSPDPEVQKAIMMLQACFGKYREFSEQAMENESELPDDHSSAEIQAFWDSRVQQLEVLVDCLFDILPSIDRLRQIWLLDLERKSRIVAASLAKTATITSSKLHEVTQDDVGINAKDSLNRSVSGASISDELDMELHSAEGPLVQSNPRSSPQLERIRGIKPRTEAALAPPEQEILGYQEFLSAEDKASLQKLLAMDLELATALRLSVVESQTKATREKQEDQALMSQIKSWDDEIKRLKDWSNAFDASLGGKPSEAETRKQYSVFEQLAKIGNAFANAMARNKIGSNVVGTAKQRLESVTRTMTKSAGKKFDLSYDFSDTTTAVALDTFQEANDNLHNLAVEMPDTSVLPHRAIHPQKG